MENHLHHSKFWSVTMKPIKPLTNLSPLIVVHLTFSHSNELHRHCIDPTSPSLDNDQHNTLSKELLGSTSSWCTLFFPLELETLCFRIAAVEEEGLPEFVTSGGWSYLKEKVLNYLLQNVEFYENQGLGFEMEANLHVSTVDVLDDYDCIEDCFYDYEEDYDDHHDY